MTETTLERIQADTRTAMKAGERDRVGALRLIADALQKDLKDGGDDEVAVLRRERKRRLEAADAYRNGGDEQRAAAEDVEAELITAYLPEAVAQSGASGMGDMGKAMGVAMGKAGGRADGKRVSAAIRERLAGD